MDIRRATADDVDAIRSIARDSLSSSYTDFLEGETIENAVEQWYGDDITEEFEADDVLFLVVETDEGVVGFSQSELIGENHDIGQILWLHVHPDHRGGGTGVRLLVRTREELLDFGADQLRSVVLADNELGNEFYATHGFERAGTREVDVGEKTYTENVFVGSDLETDDQWRSLEEIESDGETLFVSYGEAARGSKAPFYTAYETDSGEERYGWFCGNCNSLDNAMDSMGRIECNACGNRRKATRWDASYL
ncbi:GNAT family N-acetyltransferase [Natrononativus amylolyticus]|uniref:GNAT family N-acetyltransferase n=1 Tax=Natrononativus amylolyticus TaxID=2963434 RepID=UPI0020CFA0FA|nr:GNAT family N-acetyltransferase [Natrononativus amylolyticus]